MPYPCLKRQLPDPITPAPQDRQRPAGQSQTRWAIAQRILAILACLLLLPLFIILYVIVRSTSRGPFLFTQHRRGYHDKPFQVFKIRTMLVKERNPTILAVSPAHPDVTRVGRFLRELKLDELPQLWNVVRGEMAFVGPRPIATDLDDFLRRHIPNFANRNRVPPGLTSLGQLHATESQTPDGLLQDWRKRSKLDLQSIRHGGFLYDLRMLTRTAFFVLRRLLRMIRPLPPSQTPPASLGGTRHATVVLNIPIANASYDSLVNQIAEWISQRSSRYIGVCAVHNVVLAVRDPAHRRALQSASLNTADGMPVVWAQRLLGHRYATRITGSSLMLKVLQNAQTHAWRIVLYGGTPYRLHQLVANLLQQFPNLNIADAISPPFRPLSPEEDQQMVNRLNRARPDVLFVGIGCPKQERWMLEHTRRIPSVMIGVGAAFDFHAGALRRAPEWLQKTGLEWAFRLACEPRRLFMRYATTNPVYIALILRQLFKKTVLKHNYQVALDWPESPQPQLHIEIHRPALRRPSTQLASPPKKHQSGALASSSPGDDAGNHSRL